MVREKTKVTIRIFTEDAEFLRRFFHRAGYNIVIRNLVHHLCRQMRDKAAEAGVPADATGTLNTTIDLDELGRNGDA